MNAPNSAARVCDYCGLPVPQASEPQAADPVFCCLGCRFARAVAAERGSEGRIRWTMTRLGLAIFFTMNVMVFTLALWTQDVFQDQGGDSAQLAQSLHDLYRYICLLAATPVVLLLGGPLIESTWASLRQRRMTTDLLLLLGVAASFLYSAVSVLRGSGHVYFEVSCMVLVAVTLGRWLEAVGKLKTTEAVESLGKLLPDEVQVESDGGTRPKPLDQVRPGDVIRVPAGQRIATDGRIVRNQALVDQQVLTGESEPRVCQSGDDVLGGALNVDGDLWIQVTAAPSDGTLARMMDAVRKAAQRKGAYEKLADRVAAWFLPAVVAIALTTLVAHWHSAGLRQGLMAGLAVVLIACPCALGLATPMAIWAALGRAARRQVLFRDGDALVQLDAVTAVALDKTGTLTGTQPEIADLVVERPVDRAACSERAAALAATNVHPLSAAIVSVGGGRDVRARVGKVRLTPGRGVQGVFVGKGVTFLGSPDFMREQHLQCGPTVEQALETAAEQGQGTVCIGWEQRVRGVIVLSEQLRPGAVEVVRWLKAGRRQVVLLTGDTCRRAELLASKLEVDVRAELLPADKLSVIARLQQDGHRVAMVGDGVNDAPALAAADVGIAMGSGADIARQSAPVNLLGSELVRLPWAMALSRETQRTIRQNLIWAFAYNTIGVGVAAVGWLNPILAAVAMLGSSLFVVSNSLRLGRFDPPIESGTASSAVGTPR